jgi:hypothetical protein
MFGKLKVWRCQKLVSELPDEIRPESLKNNSPVIYSPGLKLKTLTWKREVSRLKRKKNMKNMKLNS